VAEQGAAALAAAPGRSPWALAWRRLRRNRIALAALGVFALIVVVCLAAPLYADHVAHTDPFTSNVSGTTIDDGASVPVMQEGPGLGTTPIGPTWDIRHYFLGADGQGRDVAARLLYGGRNSLVIALVSALLCCAAATLIGLLAGFYGGWVDGVLSRAMDVLWAIPFLLLAICISTVVLSGGLSLGLVTIGPGSLWLPILLIGILYIPYVARPIRGQVLSLGQKEFVEAAVGQGASNLSLMLDEILPNVLSTVIVFLPLLVATNMLFEAALSFLGIGVQPPDASWGTIINDGQELLYTRPTVAIAPGLCIVLCVLSLNVFGDGVRDALDPRAKLRLEAK
jgi:peptide/nickel transport system permease protein